MTSSPTQPIESSESQRSALGPLWSVVIAGEAIFVLPFLLPRLFRPAMMEAWGLDNLQFGLAFSAYGIVAMISYLLGGPLADRFDPRKLMSVALLVTSCGSIALVLQPSASALAWLYAFFGLSTILLFWSAMIRVTHRLGGDRHQGAAFGILDAGRGLFAAILASVMMALFAAMVPDVSDPTDAQLERALRWIVIIGGASVATAALILWVALRDLPVDDAPTQTRTRLGWRQVVRVALQPSVWLQGVVVLCAYCGYKSIDNYGIFAVDAFGFSDVKASLLTTIVFWARPVAAICAGVCADVWGNFRVLAGLFFATALGNLVLVLLGPEWAGWAGLCVAATSTAAAVYGLRGIYFAVFDDLSIPKAWIGTAAGIVSTVGFLPDIFFGSLSGYVIDSYPGAVGHRIVFTSVAVLSLCGMAAVIANRLLVQRGRSDLEAISSAPHE